MVESLGAMSYSICYFHMLKSDYYYREVIGEVRADHGSVAIGNASGTVTVSIHNNK